MENCQNFEKKNIWITKKEFKVPRWLTHKAAHGKCSRMFQQPGQPGRQAAQASDYNQLSGQSAQPLILSFPIPSQFQLSHFAL